MSENQNQSQQEYNALVRNRDSTRNSYNALKEKIEDAQHNINNRLIPARNRVRELKELYETLKANEQELLASDNDWQGQKKQYYAVDWGYALDVENEKYLKEALDRVHDSINNEITRIQNDVLSDFNLGLLDDLLIALNTIQTKINNFFN